MVRWFLCLFFSFLSFANYSFFPYSTLFRSYKGSLGSFDNIRPGSLGPFDNMIRPGSFSPFDNIHLGLLDHFDINPPWFAWFLLLIYDSLVPLVPLIIYGSLVPLIISWFSFL